MHIHTHSCKHTSTTHPPHTPHIYHTSTTHPPHTHARTRTHTHTHTQPLDSSACRRGCRLAQIESLIAWPFSPQKETCTNSKFHFQVTDASECMQDDVSTNKVKCLGKLHKVTHIWQTLYKCVWKEKATICGASLE